MPKTHRRSKKPRLTARTADRHTLYQNSVQDTESEARFLARTFEKITGRPGKTLREDFCGTALLCAEWVKKDGRTAIGIDLDPDVLAWGTEHNLAPLGEPGNRIALRQQDVRDRCPGRFDLTVALNFSYFIFRTRSDLRGYFASVRRSMAKDGVFFVDAYGGYESWQAMEEPRKLKGFTYVWDQDEIDPINNSVVNYIHFEFPDGSKINKAFTYEWRLWTIPEIREVLAEAGFSRTTVYWENGDKDGEGTGVFRPRTHVAQEAAWVAYIVAER
jgi:cyclopropane fatty-acyl-phospholipid synthase-like methyltransferase